MTACPDCKSTHMGPPCGTTYAGRLRSVQLDPRAVPTRTMGRNTYYDSDAVREAFGEDSKDRMLEATQGLGPAKQDTRGRWWRRERKSGELVPVTEKEADRVYLGGNTEEAV